ncbi:DNA-processing protein DprA [Agarivorans sp. Alg241-V36]|uniref:DNA-processing protein DprA n=1 Tax=Agarivorans sp. Alg241-V36 TaxID=2305992 RepID=UPI0013D1033A|nr:DNA-processing protein DprA [Agarivorans sp. Alg241-V36]
MITENTKAILLLTSLFSSKEAKVCKPLSINEYGYFACWLHQNGYHPESLLDATRLTEIWMKWELPLSHAKAKKMVNFSRLDDTIDAIYDGRISALLNRGASLSLALEKWQSAGIWILDRSHSHYPKAFRGQLKHQSPAILFGVGNSELLLNRSIGFVGSRDCDSQDEQATANYVAKFSQHGYQVVSGGAKGVDSHAMEQSLKADNNAIGVMSDSLFKNSAVGQWRQYLKSGQLVLISPFYPESRFTPANAMARNKYIYLLSQATMVITSAEKGGTWSGAKENLYKGWVPLLVSAHKSPLQKGNHGLLSGEGLPKGYSLGHKVTPEASFESMIDIVKAFINPLQVSTEVESQQSQLGGIGGSGQDTLFSPDLFTEQNTQSTQKARIENQAELSETTLTIVELTESDEKESEVQLSTAIDDGSQDAVEFSGLEQDTISVNASIESETPDSSNLTMPLLDYFYKQLKILLTQNSNQPITQSEIAEQYPEFSIMGKTSLAKWLAHLVSEQKLIRPGRAKSYQLPD